MAIFERDGYGTICYPSQHYRSVLNRARREFDYHIRMAKFETRQGNSQQATIELKDAAVFRRMIVSSKKDLYYAIAKGK